MTLLISLVLAEIFLLLCAKTMKKHPGIFYAAAALLSAAVTGLYWAAPEGISPAALNKLPLWMGALGTACFIEVMIVGALPNGHPIVKRTMPIRGELSIFACLLTLGQNLSYGKNYFAPGYLFSGTPSATKIAARISVVMIALMLVLTVTSIKAVRRKFSAKRWKALQRWAYLFYALIYVHVLLMSVPAFLKGRGGYGLTLLVYSAVFLSYAVCRVRKAVLVHNRQTVKVTSRSQLAAAGTGVLAALVLVAGLRFANPQASPVPAVPQTPEPISQDAGIPDPEPEAVPAPDPAAEPEPADGPDGEPGEVSDPPAEDAGPEPAEAAVETTEPEPEAQPVSAEAEEPEQETPVRPEPVEEPVPELEPEPEPEPAPEPSYRYQDGTYTGSGEGYYGKITVSVTIAGDLITDIHIDSYIDDDDYFGDAQDGVVPAILSSQSPDVSAVSGATYSSRGIMAAVRDALSQAEN